MKFIVILINENSYSKRERKMFLSVFFFFYILPIQTFVCLSGPRFTKLESKKKEIILKEWLAAKLVEQRSCSDRQGSHTHHLACALSKRSHIDRIMLNFYFLLVNFPFNSFYRLLSDYLINIILVFPHVCNGFCFMHINTWCV